MIQIILGQYIENKVLYMILSDKDYLNTKIFINNEENNQINIKAYKVNKFYFDNIKIGNDYKIEFIRKNKLIDSIEIKLKSNPLDNVLVVNCDSCYGYESGTWDLIENKNTRYIFHLGDQIYNDHIFYDLYKDYEKKLIDEKQVYKYCYLHYLYHFSRNNKKNVLKNNFNLMIPDDHEILDNSVKKLANIVCFKKVYNIFKSLSKSIELGLRHKKCNLLFLEDSSNSTVYILNYTEKFDEEFYIKNNYLQYVKRNKNIIFLNRKCIGSVKNSMLNQVIFKNPPIENYNIDYMLKLGIKYPKKNIYVLCGDYHMKNSLKYFKNQRQILEIKNVGAINTVVDIFSVNFILESKISDITLQSDTTMQNGFVSINYENKKIRIEDIINKKNILYHLGNSVTSAKEFILMKYLK
jgi:hypothetical protein